MFKSSPDVFPIRIIGAISPVIDNLSVLGMKIIVPASISFSLNPSQLIKQRGLTRCVDCLRSTRDSSPKILKTSVAWFQWSSSEVHCELVLNEFRAMVELKLSNEMANCSKLPPSSASCCANRT